MPVLAQSANNVASGTGFGQFDLQLVTGGTKLVNVTVKMFFRDGRGDQSTPLASYVADMRGKVQGVWDNKLVFQCGGEQFIARFNVQQVVTAAAAHFSVILLDGAYGAGSGLKFASPGADPCGVGTNNVYLELKGCDNQTYATGNAVNLQKGVIGPERGSALMDARDSVVRAAPGGGQAFNVHVLRNTNDTWRVDPGDFGALDNFCASIVNTPQWLVQPPLLVHAESGIQTKADALVQCVVNYIRGKGVTGRIDSDPAKVKKKFRFPFTKHKSGATVQIQVLPMTEMIKEWQSDYVVSAHEFGHCLGVPDEYLDYSGFQNTTIKNSQPLWDGLCDTFGATRRNWKSQFNESIMSIGRTLYRAHGATICNGLDTMTQTAPNNLPAGSWTVVGP